MALALIFVLFGAKLAIDEFNEDERFDDHRSQAAGAFSKWEKNTNLTFIYYAELCWPKTTGLNVHIYILILQ